ncbi:MAG: F0F1 ATP synthase subunit A [Roseiflexus sp.]|jgi:F-type H+-transporting ATPase subunit a|nr:F0F1 ATP synthase subunit A [Roseiflexus sp.]MBO9334056.1 F0F1 ATP synthase subunit A [Roseiflexus sp.]MBO9364563.1 F0F1 ATP synthase subunit A [Roseiflexus sp.]MBO9383097.1 F0F1 ATP synthase subunit A [Roseiflexus sp.]MBO9388274.1 F0F1 ATP synthase subunit A [Roseiflexus sp.]
MRNRILTVTGILLVLGIVLYIIGVRSTKLHISVAAEPVFCLGGVRATLETCASGFPITNSLITTVIVLIIFFIVILAGTRNMQLIPRGFQNTLEVLVEAFYNFAQGVDRKNVAKFFPFCASAFFFMLVSNITGLIPGVGSIGLCVPTAKEAAIVAPIADVTMAEEPDGTADFFASWPLACEKGTTLVPILRAPTADLNMTLAWALASVALIQFFGFQALGVGYLTKFFNFREGFMMALVGILELISEFVRIIAFAFRLFGNIFAGEVILVVMAFLFPYLLPAPFYAFELFVAFIQALIFAVLSLVFMSLATEAHGGHHGETSAH